MKIILLIILTIIGWTTLATRIYIKITTSGLSIFESMVEFFSYFTILTNLLVTIYCSVQLLSKNRQKTTSLFFKPETLTALTVYILIVGAVYHIVLKSLWNPQGLDMITSEIHHTFVPFGTLALWIISPWKELYKMKNLMRWLLFPILYISFIVIRGSYSAFYPYPFINVAELGIGNVLINSVVLFIVIIILFLVFYFIENKIIRKNDANKSIAANRAGR